MIETGYLMTTDNSTLLCTGDLHLGRHPTRIPAELDGPRFSPKAAWRSTVQEAIDRAVDAVLVTGDVVDRENRFFEAYGPFEAGLERLDDATIPVVVVSGNHDFDLLPRLIDGLDLEHVHVLGEDGDWERTTVERNGDPRCYVDGWSYPEEHVFQSPLEDYDRSSPGDAPLIGLVHAELDARESEYAPVQTAELVDTPADAWLLGHVHKPQVHRPADPFVAYPGSPQALDPGERGPHGPWAITVDPRGRVEAEQVPLASLRYDRLEVDVSDADDPKAVPTIVSDRLSEHVRSDVETGPLELLLARVGLTGRTPVHGKLVEQRNAIEERLSFKAGSLPVRVETLEIQTRPEVDLDALARGDSPAAYLAELLLALDRGEVDEEYRQLVGDARDAMQRAYASSAYNELRREDRERTHQPDETDAVETLERQGKLLLDALLEQKEGPT